MSTELKMLVIEDVESGELCQCTAASFLENNAECFSVGERQNVERMAVGAELMFGGGAVPLVRVRRVS